MAKQVDTTETTAPTMSTKTYRLKPDGKGRPRPSITHPTLGLEIKSEMLNERTIAILRKEDKFQNITFVDTNIELAN